MINNQNSIQNKISINEDIIWLYEYVVQYIKSPVFRDPIKEFIDQNCINFESEDSENSFEQTKIHNQFKKLIDDMLEMMLIDLGASYEQFLEIAKYGLNSSEKKYFEQIIACENYVYFKNLMVKRNLLLQKEAYELMYSNISKADEISNSLINKDGDYIKLQKEKEEKDIQAAIQMSLALEEEKKKISDIENEELRKAIEISNTKEGNNKKIKPLFSKGKKANIKNKDNLKESNHLANDNINKDQSTNNEINEIYENIAKDKEKKLKEYREMVVQMKKEKRDKDLFEDEEEKPKKENTLEENIAIKRLEMRKLLANKLKNKN